MKKTFNGLCALIRSELGSDPLSGDVFIFFNRHRNQTKLILWEHDGFGIFHKRLERGTYELPVITPGQSQGTATSWQELQLMYSLMECCRMHQVDPYTWLLDVMKRIENHPKDQLADLLPHKWKKLNQSGKSPLLIPN
jgi:transposase